MRSSANGRRFEAICFDLDETLIDSAVAWRQGFLDAFALEVAPRYPELGATAEPLLALQPFLLAEVEARRGRWGDFVIRDAVRKFFRTHGIDDERAADRTTEAYEAAWPQHITLFPDALPALDAARELGPLALITNGPSTGQRLKLERTGLLADLFADRMAFLYLSFTLTALALCLAPKLTLPARFPGAG